MLIVPLIKAGFYFSELAGLGSLGNPDVSAHCQTALHLHGIPLPAFVDLTLVFEPPCPRPRRRRSLALAPDRPLAGVRPVKAVAGLVIAKAFRRRSWGTCGGAVRLRRSRLGQS